MGNEIELKKLALEELRLNEELKLKRMEIELQREQFAANQKSKGFLAQAFSPVGVAVIVGLMGLIGTAAGGLINANIESRRQQANLILENQKQESSLLLKMTEIPDEKQRALNLLFFAQGGYLKFTAEYTSFLRQKAELKEGDEIPPPATGPTTALVDVPANANQGVTAASVPTLKSLLGNPIDCPTGENPPPDSKLSQLLIFEDVGPFKVRGLRPAVEALRRIFADVKQHEPDLFAEVHNAGMYVCKQPERPLPSKHNWGIAIDIHFGETIASSPGGKVQSGLARLNPYFRKEKFFWLANAHGVPPKMRGVESMHFEASAELIKDWQESGKLQ